MPSAADFFAWLNSAADFAEKHPTITIAIASLIALFGTPEIGPSEKPWVKPRPGLGWFALKALQQHAERTQVWKNLEARADEIINVGKENVARVGALEKVSDWQTRVLLLIASTLKIDVTKTLDGSNVAVVARESTADVGGKKLEQPSQSPTVAG